MTSPDLHVLPGTDVSIVADRRAVRDLRPLALNTDGRIAVMPASFWATTTRAERALFGSLTGIYSFPTEELVDHLRERIGGRSAIEIGAGHGVLAETLGIPATDSRMHEKPPWNDAYKAGSPYGAPAPYGPNVIDMHASRAVRHYRPDVVIGCWITHKDDPTRQGSRGNPVGVDEPDILLHCTEYILIGHQFIHRGKPIWARPHRIEYPEWLFSRAANPSPEMIVTWPGAHRGRAG